MKDSVRLGRVAGIGLGINWSLFVMVALVAGGLADNRFPLDAPGYSSGAYAAAGVVTAAGLFAGVLLHEMAHAVVARRAGLPVAGITLSWMGGLTRIEGESPGARVELAVAGVGPLTSAVVGGLLLALQATTADSGTLYSSALGWLGLINLLLAVFNLLPAAPLDGGKVLHSVVWAWTHDRWRATRIAAAAGIGLGVLMVAVGFIMTTATTDPLDGLFVSIIGWWLIGAARMERMVGAMHNALDGVLVSQVMRPVGAAPGWITVRAFTSQFAAARPGWVWLLESWGGHYSGVVTGDALSSVPYPQWDIARPVDFCVPIDATFGASPNEPVLEVMERAAGRTVILVVDGGHTVGAVLASDIEAAVKSGRRNPVGLSGWTLTRG